MSKKLATLVSTCLAMAFATGVQAATLKLGSDADTYVIANDTAAYGGAAYMYLHNTSNAVGYLRFNLAAADITAVESATLTLYTSGGAPRNDNVITARFFLHGLNSVAGNTPQNWDEANLTSANVGAEWKTNAGATLVNVTDMDDTTAGAGITETVTLVGTNYYDVGGIRIVVTGARLVEFLQSRVDDDGLATFLLEFPGEGSARGFGIASKENTTETLRPVLELTATVGPRTAPSSPSPADKATGVSRDTSLSWRVAAVEGTYSVYMGTSLNAVTARDASVLVSQGQDANSFDSVGHLAYGQTYSWRVDAVAPDSTIQSSPIWNFTVEPVAYQIANVTATASGSDAGTKPENVVNGAGLNASGQHSTANGDMWFSGKSDSGRPWIQFAFDQLYKLHEMRVWNYNTALESILGGGCREVMIEYSRNGTDWTVLSETAVFNQAPGSADYAYNTTVDFQGIAAQFVRLTPKNNWGGVVTQCGLSEVQFFQIPVQAREPVPATAATDIDPRDLVLSWKPGREAASHEVSLGTDSDAVAAGNALVATIDQPTYEPAPLLVGTTYYWKIVEVNDAASPSAWTSDVWSFSTPAFVAVDDFDAYTDEAGQRIYESWLDGYEDAANGSVVGYAEAPFAEQKLVHSGRQSMPLAYDNTGGVSFSEAKRTFETPQDWTKHGVKTLALFFQGQTSNAAAPVYLKINDTKIAYNNGAAAATSPLWKQWNIPLTTAGVNFKSVKSLAIGVEGSGAGTLFVDDIRLYATAPEVVVATNPGTTGLVALYTMDDNVQDSSGRNYHGVLTGDVGYGDGYAGKALNFNGTSTHVSLPIGPLVNTLSDMTIATHVNFNGGAGSWQRIFDFGTDTTVYMFLSPRQATAGSMRFAIRTAAVAEQIVDSPAAMPTGWHHAAISIDSATMTMKLYLDGEQVGSAATTLLPKDLGKTTQNWLGRSQWTADAYFSGMLDEFRIYNRVLSAAEVRYLAGDR
jgi:hypothetical protein